MSWCPKPVQIAVLVNPANVPATESAMRDIPEAARTMGLQIQVYNASTRSEPVTLGDPHDSRAFHESLQRLEVTHHSRNQLRHRGMDVHRALHHRVRRLGVHNIENAVDDLITRESQKGGAQYLFAISIH
jgi:hypothetical protein